MLDHCSGVANLRTPTRSRIAIVIAVRGKLSGCDEEMKKNPGIKRVKGIGHRKDGSRIMDGKET